MATIFGGEVSRRFRYVSWPISRSWSSSKLREFSRACMRATMSLYSALWPLKMCRVRSSFDKGVSMSASLSTMALMDCKNSEMDSNCQCD